MQNQVKRQLKQMSSSTAVLLSLLISTSVAQSALSQSKSFISTTEVTPVSRQTPVFIENRGQWDPQARFHALLPNASVWLTADGARFELLRPIESSSLSKLSKPAANSKALFDPLSAQALTGQLSIDQDQRQTRYQRTVVVAHFEGVNPSAEVQGKDLLPARYNFFTGSDPANWQTNVPSYSSVIYENIYQNIDLRYFHNGKNLEYEFIAAPGADLSQIKIRYEGIESLSINAAGDLEALSAEGVILRELSPLLYQSIDGAKVELHGTFELSENQTFSILAPSSYDKAHAITIDPVVVFVTEFGGSSEDEGADIAVDNAGNLYIVGTTSSTDFPTIVGSSSEYNGGVSDAFLSKLSGDDHSLIYTTFIGGDSSNFTRSENNGADNAFALTLGQDGAIYIIGSTFSVNFPTTPGAYLDAPYSGPAVPSSSSRFASKLSAAGDVLLYSTLLYGTDGSDLGVSDIAVDDLGAAYIVGATWKPDMFPRVNELTIFPANNSGSSDMTLMKLSSDGSSLLYSTLLGGSSGDLANMVGIDALGQIVIVGYTWSTDFPLVNAIEGPNLDATGFQWGDVAIVRISADGSNLVYSTYLGGSNMDFQEGATLASDGSIYITGATVSPDFNLINETDGNFPSFWAHSFHGGYLSKIGPSGSLEYSSYIDGGGKDIAVDISGNTYVLGYLNRDFSKIAPDGPCLIRKDVNIAFGDNLALENDGTAHILGTSLSGTMTIQTMNPSPDYVCGDADNSCSMNIADVVFMIARVFSGGPAPVIPAAGDANGDGSVNIGDVTAMIATIFSGGPTSLCGTTGF